MIYRVSYADHDNLVPYIVEGPEVSDWKAFCDALLPEACERTMRARPNSWIGWDEIIECLVEVLGTKGYARLRPVEAMYEGAGIIGEIRDMNFLSDQEYHSYKEVPETPELRAIGERLVALNAEIRRMTYHPDEPPIDMIVDWTQEGF